MARQQQEQRALARPTPSQMAKGYEKALKERGDMTPARIRRAVQRYKEGLQGR